MSTNPRTYPDRVVDGPSWTSQGCDERLTRYAIVRSFDLGEDLGGSSVDDLFLEPALTASRRSA
jgi:hypothetical protein